MPDEATQPAVPVEVSSSGGTPVVGFGASAGGIEALIQFFDAMPADSGFAFIVVLHLDPDRQSYLTQILAQHTVMPVAEVADGMTIKPNHVFVIAPRYDLTLLAETLCLRESAVPRRHRHPVDVLFRSLAEQRGHRAVAIVLSGTGSNGTQGLRDIRGAGGLALIQDPASAQFDGMPRSALGADLADHVLAPAEMPAILMRHRQHSYVSRPNAPAAAGSAGELPTALGPLLDLLESGIGHSFHNYRSTTLLRRINRRMSLKNIDALEQYVELVRSDPAETIALARDLLINVTSFFRDTEAWATLDTEVITKLVDGRKAGAVLRVWVPACATGEEAYSIAMLVMERTEQARKRFDLKVFASDLLEDNLNVARAGIYTAANVERLPAPQVGRFFEKVDLNYQVRKELRDVVVFARQDLMRDPPFARIDLVSCRNMLIYIEPEAQARALAIFHFALKTDGVLFLGSAETTGRAADLFDTVSERWRIYRRVGPTRYDLAEFGGASGNAVGANDEAVAFPSPRLTDALRRALLDRYVPAAVIVNGKGRVLYFHGEVETYLRQPSGEPTQDLLAMARDGLLAKLRTGLEAVRARGSSVESKCRLRQGDAVRQVVVTLAPLPVRPATSELIVVTFVTEPAISRSSGDPIEPGEVIPELEAELRSMRAELHGAIEQLETANEELSRANKDAVVVNEELQSTNEELETSKEELQSFNEELHSVNTQLQHKINEVEEVSNDLFNLLSGTEMAILFLDTELRVKWSSPEVKQLFDLVPGDVGRPISHFARKFIDENLLRDAEQVMARLMPIEVEVLSDDGTWFVRRILPYRTRDQRIAGLVVTFFDVTARKMSAAANSLRDINQELEHRVTERTEALENANRELVRQGAEQRRIEEEMNFLAHHDRLTGLPNRRRFGNLLPAMLDEAERSGGLVAILCLDLDGFKTVNDTMGHHAGDRLLQVVARRLTGLLRPADVIARFGGDEFVAMQARLESPDEAAVLAERMVAVLAEPVMLDGQYVRVGASIGVTIAPRDGSEPERLLRNADIALYQAKADGGRGWRVFTSEMFIERTRRQTIEADLRQAVSGGEFELLYQPMVSIPENRVTAFEVLLRWRHPVHGILTPGAFMRIAEETGMIVPIGRWVLARACRDAMSWPKPISVAVNLSAAQIRDPTILTSIVEILAETGLPAERLEIEVTESVMLERNAVNQRTLTQLHQRGVLVAMDDFGTGYSSLSQLRAFPYGKLKLDRSFIRTLAQDEDALVVVRTILALGKGLRMVVTAEGVETPEQLEILTRLGCPQVQGYLLGHPAGSETVGRRLAQGAGLV